MKQNIEFYPHYATSDQHAKFKMLRVGFGWAGEGKFWALNNKIAIAEKCCLDISKKYNKASLANDLEFSLDEFDEFIDFLKDDCELIKECEKGVITTDIIQEAFGKVMHERDKARARHRRTSGEKTKTSGEEIYKVKESKEKENKEIKDNIYISVFDFWNLQKIVVHRKIDSKTKTAIKTALKTYQDIEIEQAIESYSFVLKSDQHFFNYKWPLVDFLNRGLKNFVNEADPIQNYLANKTKQGLQDPSNQVEILTKEAIDELNK